MVHPMLNKINGKPCELISKLIKINGTTYELFQELPRLMVHPMYIYNTYQDYGTTYELY